MTGAVIVLCLLLAESDIEVENDIDNNFVERPNVMIEPKARKLSLRSTIVGQPGILAGELLSTLSPPSLNSILSLDTY